MDYVIKGQESEPPKQTVVELEKCPGGRIKFWVGIWSVFELYPDGTGRLRHHIPKDNKEGLQVDEEGRIKLVE